MKKLSLILIFLSFSSLTYGQNFELAEPNVLKLKEQISSGIDTEVIFHYLKGNYKMNSEKSGIKYYESDKTKACAFTQEFEKGIKYSISECTEAGGISVDLELPKIERNELMKWIEQIYNVDKVETDSNVWKKNNSKFEPKEVNPGCYFEIKEKNKKTIIELYCGC
jgi:hypothetical protein